MSTFILNTDSIVRWVGGVPKSVVIEDSQKEDPAIQPPFDAANEIIIEGAPEPPEDMQKPRFIDAENWKQRLQNGLDVWEEAATQIEVAAIEAEKAKQLAASQLRDSDKDMARIAEDFYDYMMANDANFATAMPQSVHNKIAERKALRAKL